MKDIESFFRSTPGRLYTIALQGRFLLRLKGGRRVFVKISASNRKRDSRFTRSTIVSEKICLKYLEGLAVPALVQGSPRSLGLPVGNSSPLLFIQEYVPGRPLHKAGLNPSELMGAWLFIAEQLAAFRRHDIQYTDIKATNIVARRRPLRVTLVDFGMAMRVRKSGRYPSNAIGFTPGFQAPEHVPGVMVTERAVVFQLGMLFAHALTGLKNFQLLGPRGGLARMKRSLKRDGFGGMADLVESCLEKRPADRPSGFRDVLRRFDALPDSKRKRQALAAWDRLRAPYRRRLEILGLVR